VTEPGTDTPVVWAISDGAAGNERQALALARAMGLDPQVLRIDLRAPWRWFAPRLAAGAQRAFEPRIAPPWPDIAIGCGRHAALLTRQLRAWSGGRTFTVQILDPRVDAAAFDLVIAPRHDGVNAPNALRTLGALNPVDDAWLAAAHVEFSTLQQLPGPRTALLVGGPRRGLGQGARWLDGFLGDLRHLLDRDGGSLMVSLSRRTPPQWRERLHGAFRSGCVHFWGSAADGPNPYAGYLAWAERIVVTPDSVNMLSEACATGAPVLTRLPARAGGKLAALHAALRSEGRLHTLRDDATISTLPHPPPLRETAAIGAQVWQRYRARAGADVIPPP
jgi:mitochondrial fission protein ELM1